MLADGQRSRPLRLVTFGRFTVCGPAGCDPIGGWRDRHAGRRGTYLLLARLALDGGRWLSRERLVDAIWPESDYGAALSSFYAALRSLRERLSLVWPALADWVECEDGNYRLRTDDQLQIDSTMFRDLVRRADQLSARRDPRAAAAWRAAWDLYGGAFLEDAHAAEPWIFAARHGFEERAIVSALALAEQAALDRAFVEGAEILWTALSWRPDDERLRGALRSVYAARGSPSLLEQFRGELREIDELLSRR